MKCENCGFENKKDASFCTKCGSALEKPKHKSPIVKEKSNTSKYIIIALVVVIIILAAASYFVLSANDSQDGKLSDGDSNNQSVASSENTAKTKEVQSESWKLIGSYSGSGSGSKMIDVPSGEIMVKISAYPIKNYATNYLYVSGSNGEYAEVSWDSTSPVETRSDSFTYISSSEETFSIVYYETESWEVEFYSYQ